MSEYAHPEVLVTTAWVADHLNDPQVRLIEVDLDTSAYEQGHIPGAVGWNWQTQLQDTLRRDLADQHSFGQLAGSAGITPDMTVILYGDSNNWFAAWAFWQLKYYGHSDVRLMNGGRDKWLEEKHQLSTIAPRVQQTTYMVKSPDPSIRAMREDIFSVLDKHSSAKLVDVRLPEEFNGRVLTPPGISESAQRGGHIPGAVNIPWSKAVAEDGTFKPADVLRQLYRSEGITGEQGVIAYCRIGERSSHTWFVLKYLLGYENVRNYDGSWTEWGNLVGAPIEKEIAVSAR